MPEQIAGAITKEALVMAGFEFAHGDYANCLYDWHKIRGVYIKFREGGVTRIQDRSDMNNTEPLYPPITSMPRLMDEIEAFEESLKPKEQPSEDIPLSADQFLADGWEGTSMGGGFYKQGMHILWEDDPGAVRLLVGNDESIHTSMQSLKAHIRSLIDKKYQWLL